MSDRLVLVGMLDSPFVRRVAIALECAAVPYENLPLRTFGDAAQFATYSPLKRAPTLVLADGETLFDSQLILTYLAEHYPAVAALTPGDPVARRSAYQLIGAALGLADRAVAMIYEKTFHVPEARSTVLLDRARDQFLDTLGWLETRAPERALLGASSPELADITVGAALRFAVEAHPDLVPLARFPPVADWCARLEARPEFARTYLPLDPPKGS